MSAPISLLRLRVQAEAARQSPEIFHASREKEHIKVGAGMNRFQRLLGHPRSKPAGVTPPRLTGSKSQGNPGHHSPSLNVPTWAETLRQPGQTAVTHTARAGPLGLPQEPQCSRAQLSLASVKPLHSEGPQNLLCLQAGVLSP